MSTNTMMVAADLRDEGFAVRYICAGLLNVSLNRPISIMEVETALRQSGYERHQFNLIRREGRVYVEVL